MYWFSIMKFVYDVYRLSKVTPTLNIFKQLSINFDKIKNQYLMPFCNQIAKL